MCQTTNLTENKFDTLFDPLDIKILESLAYATCITIGNLLWFGIIHYEKFGGDQQKRSILNQLISGFALLTSLGVTTSSHFKLVS
jgi:hypothetical protein